MKVPMIGQLCTFPQAVDLADMLIDIYFKKLLVWMTFYTVLYFWQALKSFMDNFQFLFIAYCCIFACLLY